MYLSHVACYRTRDVPNPVVPSFPTLSTGGALQTRVPVRGSRTLGNQRSSSGGRIPRRVTAPGGGIEDAATVDVAGGGTTLAFDTSAAPLASAAPSSDFCIPDPAMSARASSSTSPKSSCFTAPMEYAHTPTANPASARPVSALRSLKGSRARFSPGDITYGTRNIRREPETLEQAQHVHFVAGRTREQI